MRVPRRFKPIQTTRGDYPSQREFQLTMADAERAIDDLVDDAVAAAPPGIVDSAYLTAVQVSAWFDSTGLGVPKKPYDGWAICNGNNGTPSLHHKFLRWSTTSAGGTGGSDTNSHTHAPGTLVADIHLSASAGKILQLISTASFTANKEVAIAGIANSTTAVSNGTQIDGATAAPSDTENRPAYFQLVPVMRL